MLEVLYSTGIRREEACNLTIYDSDLQGGLLRINKGKGSKDRVVPLGKYAVRFLREYIQKIRPRFTRKNRGNRKLFVNISGGDLSKAMVTLLVRTYARQAKIKKKVSPHTFRHTFATELLRNGADIRAVQKMMGHSDLSVTQIYTRVAGLEVKKTHTKHHPREKEKITKEEFKPKVTRIKGEYKRDRPHNKIQGVVPSKRPQWQFSLKNSNSSIFRNFPSYKFRNFFKFLFFSPYIFMKTLAFLF